MYKEFKLNNNQTLIISITHELFNDVLIASLVGQDINKIILKCLYKNRYYHEYGHWWKATNSSMITKIGLGIYNDLKKI